MARDYQRAYDGYRYMPAGICKDHYTAMCVYVRYGKSKTPDRHIVKRKTDKYIWIVSPDRELVIGYVNHLVDDFNPDMFDECLHFDLFDENVAQAFDLSYVMPNFVHDSKPRKAPQCRSKGNPRPVGDKDRLTILSDSGGFQYISGASDYVSPLDLGRWYKDNVDSGMVLDIPARQPLGDEWITKLAKLQNRATRVIKSQCGDTVELVDIVHGKTLKERQLFRSVIEEGENGLKRMAMGGAVGSAINPLTSTDYFLDTVLTGKTYSQYHALGVTSSNLFPVLIVLGEYGDNPPHITSDSTSHKQAGLNRKIYSQTKMGMLRMNDLGLALGPPNVNWELKCLCPVCSIIKYRDVMSLLPGQFGLSLMSLHNIYETSNYIKYTTTALRELPKNEFMDYLKATHATNSSSLSKDLIQAVDYTFRAIEEGVPKARKRYASKLSQAEALYARTNTSSGRSTLMSNVTSANPREVYMERLNTLYNNSKTNLEVIESELGF